MSKEFVLPIENWLKFSNTLVGRDKLFRTIQYFSRFLIYCYERNQLDKDTLQKLQKLSTAVGLTRKLLRAGKTLDHLQIILKAKSGSITDDITRHTTILKSLGMGIWLVFDFIQWLHATDLRKLTAEKVAIVNKWAAFFWLVGILGGWFQSIHLLRANFIKSTLIDRAVHAKDYDIREIAQKQQLSLQQEKKQLMTDFMISTADMLIPANTLGYIPTNLGVVGLAGTISSLLAISTIWGKK